MSDGPLMFAPSFPGSISGRIIGFCRNRTTRMSLLCAYGGGVGSGVKVGMRVVGVDGTGVGVGSCAQAINPSVTSTAQPKNRALSRPTNIPMC